jgi:hypothetical protein
MMVKQVKPLLEQYHVTAFIAGHDHCMESFVQNGVDYHGMGASHENDPSTAHKNSVPPGSLQFHAEGKSGGFGSFTVNATSFVARHHEGDGTLLYTAPTRAPRSHTPPPPPPPPPPRAPPPPGPPPPASALPPRATAAPCTSPPAGTRAAGHAVELSGRPRRRRCQAPADRCGSRGSGWQHSQRMRGRLQLAERLRRDPLAHQGQALSRAHWPSADARSVPGGTEAQRQNLRFVLAPAQVKLRVMSQSDSV